MPARPVPLEVSALVNSLRAAVAAILLLAFAVAACSGGAQRPAQRPRSLPASSHRSRPRATGAEPSLPSGAEDLEALIPDTVGGVALQKLSMRGDEFVGSGGASAEAQEFLRSLGGRQ